MGHPSRKPFWAPTRPFRGTGHLKLLTTGGNLHFYRVRGCAGLLGSGDPATLSATFAVSPKQAITSP